MKWIGGVTAVITLLFTAIQLNRVVENHYERKYAVDELVRASDVLVDNSDFEGAFHLLEQALELSPAYRKARDHQVKMCMQYVRTYYGLAM